MSDQKSDACRGGWLLSQGLEAPRQMLIAIFSASLSLPRRGTVFVIAWQISLRACYRREPDASYRFSSRHNSHSHSQRLSDKKDVLPYSSVPQDRNRNAQAAPKPRQGLQASNRMPMKFLPEKIPISDLKGFDSRLRLMQDTPM